MKILLNIHQTSISVILLLVGIFTLCFSYILNHLAAQLIQTQIRENFILSDNDLDKYYQWNNFNSIQTTKKLYFFHINNTNEILNGKKPILIEYGPFIYTKQERNIKRFILNQTIYYSASHKQTFESNTSFRNEQTLLTYINFPALHLINEIRSFEIPPNSINTFFSFLNIRLFSISSIKEIVRGYHDRFLTLARIYTINETNPVFYDLISPIANYSDNSNENLNYHEYNYSIPTSNCKQFRGYSKKVLRSWKKINFKKDLAKSIHPENFIQANHIFNLFDYDTCNTLNFTFSNQTAFKEIPALNFNLSHESFINAFSDPLFGGKNISECFNGAPIFVSKPHFLNANKSFVDSVDGLKPEKEKHDLSLSLEPITGTMLKLVVRYQINVFVENFDKKYRILQHVRSVLLPVFWVEETYEINSDHLVSLGILFQIYKILFILYLVILCFGIFFILLSFMLLVILLIDNINYFRIKSL